jgi:hypothetical protein
MPITISDFMNKRVGARFGGGAASDPIGAALLTSLVDWFPCEEASGNRTGAHASHVLTIHPSGSIGVTTGLIGNCPDFAGAGNNVLYDGTTGDDTFSQKTAFSVLLWVKDPGVTTASGHTHIVAKFQDSGASSWAIRCNNTTLKAELQLKTNAVEVFTSANVMSNSGWDMVIAGRDGNTAFLYHNADTKISSALANTTVGDSVSAQFSIGGNDHVTNHFWPGPVDEVAFWDRVLTDAEVSWLWNAGVGRTYTDLA